MVRSGKASYLYQSGPKPYVDSNKRLNSNLILGARWL